MAYEAERLLLCKAAVPISKNLQVQISPTLVSNLYSVVISTSFPIDIMLNN